MKNIAGFFVIVAVMGCVTALAVCRNNAKGCRHIGRQNRKDVYTCTIKPMEKYGRSANKFYTNGACNFCGCSSDMHFMP